MHAIEIDSLTKVYRKRGGTDVTAVKDLSLAVAPGQVFGFLGPNGAGKTTTIKMMCGLVTPSSGAVRLNGFDVARQRGQAMRQIGVVLEGTRSVHWRLSAWENLMYFGRLKGRTGRELKERAERILVELELWDRRGDAVREFSRGMQQKVAVACALVADPPIVLLDEPTLGLDVQSARAVESWVRRQAAEEGKTILLTTHQLHMAQELCDRVAIIDNGRLLADRPVSELLGLFSQDRYEIRVQGAVNGDMPALAGLTVAEADGETTITGPISEQDALHDILGAMRAAGAPILSVRRAQPDLEEVFLRLVGREEARR
jgi:ABC-2 type transport system ATP-binding protein